MAGLPNRLPFTDRENGQNVPRLTRTRALSQLRTRPVQGLQQQVGVQPSGTQPINQDRSPQNTFTPAVARANTATDIGIEPLPRPRVAASNQQLLRVPETDNNSGASRPPFTPVIDQPNTFGSFTLAPPAAPRKEKQEHTVRRNSLLEDSTPEPDFPRPHIIVDDNESDTFLYPPRKELHGLGLLNHPQLSLTRNNMSQPPPLNVQIDDRSSDLTSAPNVQSDRNRTLVLVPDVNQRINTMSEYRGPAQVPQSQNEFPDNGFNPQPNVTPASLHRFDIEGVPPFIDLTRFVGGNNRNVVKIRNIPYGLTIAEVRQFVHKNLLPGQVNENGIYDVHIVMERTTGKTLDCFIELDVPHLLYIAVDKYQAMVDRGQHPKMGNRQVMVQSSSQGELMQQLFPRAKAVHWDPASGIPTVIHAADEFSDGFRGFLTSEELNSMVRLAEFPQRSQFSARCLQRTFECMISTLAKFPWFTTYYTVQARDKLFETYNAQLRVLIYKVVPEFGHNERNMREVGLDARLLRGFITTGLTCPGFSERQKYIIGNIIPMPENPLINSLGNLWPFTTLSRPANLSDDDVGQWLDLLAAGIMRAQQENKPLRLEPYLIVDYNGNGRATICASEVAFNDSYASMAHMENHLLRLILEYGWEDWFGERGISYQAREIQYQPLGIENQFQHLNLQEQHMAQADGGISPVPSGFEDNSTHHLLKNTVSEKPNIPLEKYNSIEPGNVVATNDTTRLGSGLGDIPRIVDAQFRSQLQHRSGRRFNPETPEFAPGPIIRNQAGATGISNSTLRTATSANWGRGLKGSAGTIQNSDGNFEYSVITEAGGQRILNIKRSPEKARDGDDLSIRPSHGSTTNTGNSVHDLELNIKQSVPGIVRSDQPVIGTPAKRVKGRNPVSIDFTIHEDIEDAEEETGPRHVADASAHGRRR